jgi:hypothetical protein
MAAPTITSIDPASGPTAGGTVVTVNGTGLDTVSAVAFGSTPAADFSALSATLLVAVSPAGTGTDAVKVTNPDGTSNAAYFDYSDGLFTVAEARAFDKLQLSEEPDYPDADILAKEAEIREWLERVCGVNFGPTTHTDEYHDGDNGQYVITDWPRIISITAASVRSSGSATWTALTADELANLHVVRSDSSLMTIYREGSYWPSGVDNVKLTYSAGFSTVPDLVKRAALRIAVQELPASNVPMSAESWDDGGVAVSFTRGDGFNGAYHRDADVMKAIRMYTHLPPACA